MGIRKYAVIAIISLIFTMLKMSAHAEENLRAWYIIEGGYNEANQTYTVDVYLDTEVYLAAGTFGMEFDSDIPVVWNNGTATDENVGYMQVETTNFDYIENREFEDYRDYFKNSHYVVLQWSVNETDTEEPVRGKIKLGSFTMENITLETAKSWGEEPFRLLDWTTTAPAQTELFTQKDEGYDKSLNDEIWRTTTKAEREAGAPVGYYQGCAYDENEWIDIGYKFTSNLNEKIKITVKINAWNPKNNPVIYAYKSDTEVFEGELTQRIIRADGYVTYDYEVEVDDTGCYTLVAAKDIHLTYIQSLTIPEETKDEYAAGEITLICGDINRDGFVKIPDRSHLILMLNHPSRETANAAEFDMADLNGDGRINLFDLNILKSNLDKTYKGCLGW